MRAMDNQMTDTSNILIVGFGFISGLLKFLAGGGYWSNLTEAVLTAFACAIAAAFGKYLFGVVQKKLKK